jgi:hypothetical protein
VYLNSKLKKTNAFRLFDKDSLKKLCKVYRMN